MTPAGASVEPFIPGGAPCQLRPIAHVAAAALVVGLGAGGVAVAREALALRPLGGGLFAVAVTMGGSGERLWMMVDTGATRSLVRVEVARRLDLTPRAHYALHTAAGVREGVCAGPVSLGLGATELAVDCLGWSEAVDEAALGPGVDGVLGADALAATPLLLDAARALLVLDPRMDRLRGEEMALELVEGRPALALPLPPRRGEPRRPLLLVVDSASEALVLFGEAAAAVPGRRASGLLTLTGTRRVATGAPAWLRLLPRPPREALLLPDVLDRAEDGLLPLSATGAVALDWARGRAILGATGGGGLTGR